MDINYHDLVDENFVDDTEQIRNITKKTWLSGAAVQLAHLDNVKTNVYNFGIADPRDLKATNLRTRRLAPANTAGGALDPPPSATSHCSSMAWGSNSSIPDLLRQHNAEKAPLPKPTRPASAKYSNARLRPPSGKKPRPQSAKELAPDIVSEETTAGFGVKGARYDPSGRPPKGIPNTTTTGWVGPPAGLKYPDKPPPGSPWRIDFPEQTEVSQDDKGGVMLGAEREVPPPPCTTPMPPTPEPDKPKRVFELYIGDPYNVEGHYEDDDLYENSDEELAYINYDDTDIVEPTTNQNTSHTHHTDSSTNQNNNHTYYSGSSANQNNNHTHYSGSSTNENNSNAHYSDNRANQNAGPTHSSASSAPSLGLAGGRESMRLDLPTAEDDYDEIDEMDTDRLLAEAESVSEKFDLKAIINSNKHLPDTSSHDTEPVIHDHSEHYSETQSDDGAETATRKRAEDLVSNIINENGLAFVTKNDKPNKPDASKLSSKNKSEIPKKAFLDHEKSSVKFKDDVTTVDITPRNIGRKVEEIHGKRKTLPPKDSGFIDLIEVKNRMEPVLSTNKLDVSPRRSRPPSSGHQKPPMGKSKSSRPTSSAGQSGQAKPHTDARKDRPTSPNHCLRNQPATPPRPRSGEPLNRAARPVTTVTVDYGEEEAKEKAAKLKKKRKKFDDVVTMMETINLQDYDRVPTLDIQDMDGFGENASDDTLESKCKSEPEKNYYEISRHSSMSHKEETEKGSSHKAPVLLNTTPAHAVVKTTKTIEFDEVNPREVTVKSVLDAQAVHKEQKEYKVLRPPSRLPSAKPPLRKPAKGDDQPSTPDRPGSRLGFVAMAPSGNKDNLNKNKPPSRPSSTLLHKRPVSASKARPGSAKKPEQPASEKPSTTTPTPATPAATQKPLSEADKEEREKVINNLLERTGLLDGADKQEKAATPAAASDHLEKKKPRPTSAHVGTIHRAKEQNNVRSAVTKRPVSASNSRTSHKHRVVSAGTGSRKSGKTKTVYTEPCIITTNTPYLDEESETEEDLACLEMHRKLKEKGLNIAPDTLQRALYPPSGRTKYYHISADLPQKSSMALLSHPREWLGEEYRRLQKAEKTLERANEIMFMQEKAEKRRAMLEGLTPEERKKLLKKKGKKGKKGAKKLRKSKTIA